MAATHHWSNNKPEHEEQGESPVSSGAFFMGNSPVVFEKKLETQLTRATHRRVWLGGFAISLANILLVGPQPLTPALSPQAGRGGFFGIPVAVARLACARLAGIPDLSGR
jgi:hypothetical protein